LSLLREIFAPSAFFSVFSEEVSVTLPDDLKGATAGIIGADGSAKTAQESNGTLKLDFTGSPVVVLKGN